jgi:cytochrome c oxidase subunit 2
MFTYFYLLRLVTAIALVALAPQSPRVVTVTAERFDFHPSRITVAPGEEIELRLTSDDTAHGFKIAGTDIDIAIPKRGQGEAVVKFKADGEGPWKFECSRMCGAGHHFMRGEIVVKTDAK